MGGEGDRAGELQALAIWVLDRGAKQWVLECSLAESGHIRRTGFGHEPIPLPLEGIGGQAHSLCPWVEPSPLDLRPGYVGGGKGAGQGLLLGAAASKRGDHSGFGASQALGGHRTQGCVWPQLDEGGAAEL